MKRKVDFSNVKESSGINPKRVEEGDYLAKVIKVEETMKDDIPMWNFHFQLDDHKTAVYPYYCKLQENQLWKLRALLVAAGKVVPKKAVTVDPESIVGKEVAISLEDDEYEGKQKSVIQAVFSAAELKATEEADDEDFDDPDDEPAEEEDEEEEDLTGEADELAGLSRVELAKRAKAAGVRVLKKYTDDDLRDMIRDAEADASDDEEELDEEELDLDSL